MKSFDFEAAAPFLGGSGVAGLLCEGLPGGRKLFAFGFFAAD